MTPNINRTRVGRSAFSGFAARAVFLALAISVLPAAAEDEAAPSQLGLNLAFVEVTNGVFAVCQFDCERKVLQRWRNVFVSKEKLPKVRGLRANAMVFALGDRPVITSNPKSPDAWNPPEEYFYNYGEIPYPIEDIDPELVCYRNTNDQLLVGFYLKNRFYAVTNLGVNASAESTQIKNIREQAHRLPPWPQVVTIAPPSHRDTEIRDISSQLRKD